MPLTSLELHQAVMEFRAKVGSTRLAATLTTTALACEEARTALMMAGNSDQKLLDELAALKAHLLAASEAN